MSTRLFPRPGLKFGVDTYAQHIYNIGKHRFLDSVKGEETGGELLEPNKSQGAEENINRLDVVAVLNISKKINILL